MRVLAITQRHQIGTSWGKSNAGQSKSKSKHRPRAWGTKFVTPTRWRAREVAVGCNIKDAQLRQW